jgi:hypothetical protein
MQQASRWLTAPWNGWQEQDFRTGGRMQETIWLPVVEAE